MSDPIVHLILEWFNRTMIAVMAIGTVAYMIGRLYQIVKLSFKEKKDESKRIS